MSITIKRLQCAIEGRDCLEVSRTNGFADIIILPEDAPSVSFGVELTERLIQFDKLYDGGERICP